MFKSIQQKLKEASILEDNEPILSFIQVVDYLKQQQQFKKIAKEELASLIQNKYYYFLASIKTADNDSTPTIYLLKLNEKTNDFKLKVTYYLDDIKSITKIDDKLKQNLSTGGIIESDVFAFELLFKDDSQSSSFDLNDQKLKFVWQCNTVEDRNDFLDTLWKLSETFLKANDRPKFINYQFEDKKSLNTSNDHNKSTGSDKDNSILDALNQQYEISKTDEDSLMKLMSECDFASSNAEKFIEKLQTELLHLDTSNIESIMNSEENTLKLIEMLDVAVDEIEKIDLRLKEYEDKISAVGDAVRIVGERDNVIQLQQNNQHALHDLLENMISSLDFPAECKTIMSQCDLSTPKKIERITNAAYSLLEILETDLNPGLKKMKAYEEQRKNLEIFKIKFCNNLYNYLRNAIGHATNKHLDTYKIVDNALTTLPSHSEIHNDLAKYKDLMPWILRANTSFNENNQTKNFYDDIKLNYIETTKQLYMREIEPFCFCAKAKIIKNGHLKNTASMENLKGSLIRSLEKSHSGDNFYIRIDQATKDTFKLVFIKVLNQLTTFVIAEQAFCKDFFSSTQKKIDDNTSMNSKSIPRTTSISSLASTGTNNSKIQNESRNELNILNDIFSNLIENQVKTIMDCIIKSENIMVIFLYSELLNRVLTSHSNKHYMHQPLVGLLRFAKEKCDEFVNQFKESIKEYKVNKREKIGILKYITYFEEFVKEAEVCWEPIKQDMYEKLCIIYSTIVNEIYKGIESVAQDSLKTPPDVVRFQNFNQMNHVLRGINGLKDSTKFAREQYILWKQSYIREHFGRPLEKIHMFFEKVEVKIERGCKHEDISYQLELSANNLKEVIREYPAKEVKKGLDNLYSKVEKHLVENSSLLEVVWRDMSNEFLKQYKNYVKLIDMCYRGHKITFEFTEQDICKFFEDIAQSH